MSSKFGWKQSIPVIAILLAGIIYIWDFHYEITWPLLTSIFAGLLIVIATVLGVNKLLTYRENVRWKQAKSSVLMEIGTCLNGMLTNIRGLAEIPVSDLHLPSTEGMTSDEWAKLSSEIITGYFTEKSGPLVPEIANIVRQRDQKSWDSFFSGVESCVHELDRLMTMFPSITSQPELVERIIAVRKNTKALFMVRITFPDVLGIPLEQQPMPKDGDKKASSDRVHDLAIGLLDELIVSIVSVKKIADNIS